MGKSVYDFQGYVAYLTHLISEQSHGGRGFRAQMADALGVQRGFVSQVLAGKAHLSLEHAERMSRFLSLSAEDSWYFLLMVQYSRAGTVELKKMLQLQMKSILSQRLILKNRIKGEKLLSYEDQSRYYSSWLYGAVRVACSIPEYQTKEAISRRLGVDSRKVADVVEFLLSRKLLESQGDRLRIGTRHLHLGNDTSMIAKHHTNWRIRAITALERESAKDLHFSSVVTLAHEDAMKLKAIIVDFIEELQKRIHASKEETIYSLNLDFFEV